MAWKNCIIFFLILFTCVVFSCQTAGVKTQKLQAPDNNCACGHYTCGCCLHLDFPELKINDTGCVNMTYLPHDFGIAFTITIDNHTIINETISARNPPPICEPVIERYTELCLQFYDLDATKTSLHGCAEIEARLYHVVVGHIKIGCFDLPYRSLGRWKKIHRLLIERIRANEKMLYDKIISSSNSV